MREGRLGECCEKREGGTGGPSKSGVANWKVTPIKGSRTDHRVELGKRGNGSSKMRRPTPCNFLKLKREGAKGRVKPEGGAKEKMRETQEALGTWPKDSMCISIRSRSLTTRRGKKSKGGTAAEKCFGRKNLIRGGRGTRKFVESDKRWAFAKSEKGKTRGELERLAGVQKGLAQPEEERSQTEGGTIKSIWNESGGKRRG